jgi:hypothetical protein
MVLPRVGDLRANAAVSTRVSAAPQQFTTKAPMPNCKLATNAGRSVSIDRPSVQLPSGYTWTVGCRTRMSKTASLKGVKKESVTLNYACAPVTDGLPLMQLKMARVYNCTRSLDRVDFKSSNQVPVIVLPETIIIPTSSPIYVLATQHTSIGTSVWRTLGNQLLRALGRSGNPEPCEFCRGAGWVERAVGTKEAGKVSWEIQQYKCSTCGGTGKRFVPPVRHWFLTAIDKKRPSVRALWVCTSGYTSKARKVIRLNCRYVPPLQPGDVV